MSAAGALGARVRRTPAAALAVALAVALAAAALGCRPANGAASRAARVDSPAADAASAWTATAASARMALTFRQHARADSLLAGYAARYPESPGAAEAAYWRALARLDPGNQGGDPTRAVAALDAYRATDPPRPHYYEAGVLRALADQADSLRAALAHERSTLAAAAAAAAANVRTGLVPRDSLRVRDEELAKARADAADARAELERVRRRLTATGARGRRFP